MISLKEKNIKKRKITPQVACRDQEKLVSPTAEFQCSLIQPPGMLPPFPPMACECLAAIHAALLGSGVKAKASLCSDKWARQDIFMETLAKPLEKLCNVHHFPFSLPQCWKHTKSPRNFLFIFFLFIHTIRSNPHLPVPDTGHISHVHHTQSVDC